MESVVYLLWDYSILPLSLSLSPPSLPLWWSSRGEYVSLKAKLMGGGVRQSYTNGENVRQSGDISPKVGLYCRSGLRVMLPINLQESFSGYQLYCVLPCQHLWSSVTEPSSSSTRVLLSPLHVLPVSKNIICYLFLSYHRCVFILSVCALVPPYFLFDHVCRTAMPSLGSTQIL